MAERQRRISTPEQQARFDALYNALKFGRDVATGAGENALAYGSGAATSAVAGLRGLGEYFAPNTTSFDERRAKAADAVEKTQEQLAPYVYPPQADVSQRGQQNIGEASQHVGQAVDDMYLNPIAESGGIGPEVATAAVIAGNVIGPKGAKVPKPKASLGLFPTTTAGRVVNATNKGGYTVHLGTGENPTEGIMMGKYANTDERNLVTDALTRAKLAQMVKRNAEALARAENHLGTWKDAQGTTYVDVSERFPPDQIRQATKSGERTGQKAGWDIGKGQEVPVGNWEDFVRGTSGPEFSQRLTEMGREGRDYLSQHRANEWWDTDPFKRVYGDKDMPQVAGFTASTAPNSAPRENLQTMTEYMRRRIKGEPIIQPDWRVPEGTMSRQAGTKIGMEEGRTANLEKSQRGALDELSADKVREEAAALMGDPNASPLDRHWARLAEDPKRGIFTAAKEGVVEPGKQYATLKGAIASHPEVTSGRRSLRDFSADVWTGIRERIKKTSELYGQKFRKGSITGESKSYADQFEDLIADKAKHLGISKLEMEARLRSGDATLLSVLGATTLFGPLLAEALQGPQPDAAAGGAD